MAGGRIHHDENADTFPTTIPQAPIRDRWRRLILVVSIVLAVIADVLVVTFILYVDLCRTDPIYLVHSLSISGLDHATTSLNRSSQVSPALALTVVGKNPSLMSTYDVEGGFAGVRYRGVMLGRGVFPAFKMTPFEEMVVERTVVMRGKRLGLLGGVGRRLVKEVVGGGAVALEIVMEVVSTRRTLGFVVWRSVGFRVWCGVEVDQVGSSGGRIVSLSYKKFKMHYG